METSAWWLATKQVRGLVGWIPIAQELPDSQLGIVMPADVAAVRQLSERCARHRDRDRVPAAAYALATDFPVILPRSAVPTGQQTSVVRGTSIGVPFADHWPRIPGGISEADMAEVNVKFLGEGALPPKGSINWWWHVGDLHMVWFYAVPKFSQAPYPRRIEIERMWVTTPESGKIVAWAKVVNPDAPMQFDEGWPDVCYYKVYGAWAS